MINHAKICYKVEQRKKKKSAFHSAIDHDVALSIKDGLKITTLMGIVDKLMGPCCLHSRSVRRFFNFYFFTAQRVAGEGEDHRFVVYCLSLGPFITDSNKRNYSELPRSLSLNLSILVCIHHLN